MNRIEYNNFLGGLKAVSIMVLIKLSIFYTIYLIAY
jgi:hypothetical protein